MGVAMDMGGSSTAIFRYTHTRPCRYIIEAVLSADGVSYTNNLLTNYPWCDTYTNVRPIIINYIRLITDFTQLLPGFVNCLRIGWPANSRWQSQRMRAKPRADADVLHDAELSGGPAGV